MNVFEAFFETAKKCAETSCKMAKEFQPGKVCAERKIDKTWVTEADTLIETRLREMISEAHPDHKILGEEHGGIMNSDPEGYTWILDPIDGTFSFVHDIPFYSSLIALCKGATPILGIASLPALNIQMSAMTGHGVWINGVRYHRPETLGGSHIEILATADPYRFRMEDKESVFERLYGNEFKARTYPDALGYYLLLNGSVRAFVDPKVEVWDVAPFHVILKEAGFAIHSWDGDGNLHRGTSVAYAKNSAGEPLNCSDVLHVLAKQ